MNFNFHFFFIYFFSRESSVPGEAESPESSRDSFGGGAIPSPSFYILNEFFIVFPFLWDGFEFIFYFFSPPGEAGPSNPGTDAAGSGVTGSPRHHPGVFFFPQISPLLTHFFPFIPIFFSFYSHFFFSSWKIPFEPRRDGASSSSSSSLRILRLFELSGFPERGEKK